MKDLPTHPMNHLQAVAIDAFNISVSQQVARIMFTDAGGSGDPAVAIPRVNLMMPTECLRAMHRVIGEAIKQVDAMNSTDIVQSGVGAQLRH